MPPPQSPPNPDIIITPEYWPVDPVLVTYAYKHRINNVLFNVNKITSIAVHLWTVNPQGKIIYSACPIESFHTTYKPIKRFMHHERPGQ